ncbi:hypothetical protein ACN20G_27895 (plasmid) [Streptomyces sp. BI20]|uniref:hypothetical protein n=1 Tax=Streptomyces sp. BI20 TaxID=3403460 RepID=UPI003C78C6DD
MKIFVKGAGSLPVLALSLVLSLSACGGGDKAETPAAASDSPSASAGVASRADLEARAKAAQVDVANVYGTEVPGYGLTGQSLGVTAEEGFSATYADEATTAQIRLGVKAGTIDAASCPKLPVGVGMGGGAAAGGPVTCTKEGERWYRVSGEHHEYATAVNGRLVRVEGDRKTVTKAVLLTAAEKARPATDAELQAALPAADGATP